MEKHKLLNLKTHINLKINKTKHLYNLPGKIPKMPEKTSETKPKKLGICLELI